MTEAQIFYYGHGIGNVREMLADYHAASIGRVVVALFGGKKS